MSESTVYVKHYSDMDSAYLLNVNKNEVLRYAGFLGINEDTKDVLNDIYEDALSECLPKISYKVCYFRTRIKWENESPVLPFECSSLDLAKCLKGSNEVVLFAATLGMDIDRLIARNERVNMTKTLYMQALGAERVEALCDTFCDEFKDMLSKEGLEVTPRYSPGYGDMKLEHQKDFFRLLDCNRKIGIALNESLLMSPSKSVTAIFGIKPCEHNEEDVDRNISKCIKCNNINCAYRKI